MPMLPLLKRSFSFLRTTPPVTIISTTQRTRTWRGFDQLKYLVVFGDSYSDVGYSPQEKPSPDEMNPLGVTFPGKTYADGPNWVGYLATTFNQSPLLVFDYAKGGEKTQNLHYHLEYEFLPQLGDKPEFAPWTAEDSLFVTWIGINDLAYGFDAAGVGRIFDLQNKLYETGARNFLLIDVPPIHRVPAVSDDLSKFVQPKYEQWNVALSATLSEFAPSHPEATTFLFSSWDTFTRILDDPTTHGFKKSDPRKRRGGMWVDHLHPTSAVHKILAEDIAKFLKYQEPMA